MKVMDDPPDQHPSSPSKPCHYAITTTPPASFIESKLASFVQLAANPAICVAKLSTSFGLLLVCDTGSDMASKHLGLPVGVKDLTDINTYK